MADISADGLLPSGSFRPTYFSGSTTVASGVTGVVITVPPPPAGQKMRLTSLSGNDSTFTVTADGTAVVTSLQLSTVGQTGFAVGKHTGSAGQVQAGLIDYIEARSTLTVTKSAGNTANSITYSYAYGF